MHLGRIRNKVKDALAYFYLVVLYQCAQCLFVSMLFVYVQFPPKHFVLCEEAVILQMG
jgi:hypothetical protein